MTCSNIFSCDILTRKTNYSNLKIWKLLYGENRSQRTDLFNMWRWVHKWMLLNLRALRNPTKLNRQNLSQGELKLFCQPAWPVTSQWCESTLPSHCVLHSVMRFWQRQTPCCGPPDQYSLRELRISQETSLIGRWLAPTSGDVSCMATWCRRQRCLPPKVLSRLTEWEII